MGAASGVPRLGLVLVHGFTSSPSMWDPLRRLIVADDRLAFVDPLPFGYATSLWKFDPRRSIPTFDTVADSLKEFLDTEAEAFDRLMVVSHSQGGLVVQRYLKRMTAEGRGADLARIGRVVMLACPNSGSEIALGLRRGLLQRNPQERELRPLNEAVTDTQRAVFRDIVHAEAVTAHSCPIPFSVYAGETDNIVPPASARSVFPDAAVLPGDHFGIAKPQDAAHRTYTTLRRLILLTATTQAETQAQTRTQAQAQAQTQARIPPPPRVPPQTPPRAQDPPPAPVRHPAPANGPAPGGSTGSGSTGSGSTGAGWAFPDAFALVEAAQEISGMDDPAFRALVIGQMRTRLPAGTTFTVPYKEHPRDHLVAIVDQCRAHRDPRAVLFAFRDAVTFLRAQESATDRLRALIGDGA